VGDAYIQFMEAESAEDQIAFLSKLISASQQAQPAGAPAPDDQVQVGSGTPPIDTNNPRNDFTPSGNPEDMFKTEEQALSFLDKIPWPRGN
jgi:hypothetical protein